MGDDLRIGGTLEISNFSPKVDRLRFQGIMESLPKYYPELHPEWQDLSKVWHGYRPCSPDGLPYMGFSKKYDNLLLATGHAMMGLSLGPATGKMVAELMAGKQPAVKVDLFDPARF
jgi:D-amino-acid dehydrogenase